MLKIYSIARFLVTTFLLGVLAWFGFMTLEKFQTRYLDTLTPAEELIRTIKDGQIYLEKYRQFGQIVQLEDVAKSVGLAVNKLNMFSKSALFRTAPGKKPVKFAPIDSLNKSIKSQKEIIDTLKEIHQEEDLSKISVSEVGNLRIELEKTVNFAIALRKLTLAEIGFQGGKILQQLKLNLLLVIGLALILYVVELILLFRALRVKKTVSKITEVKNSQPPEPNIDILDGQKSESSEVEPKDFSQTEVPAEISIPPVAGQTGEVQPKPLVDIVLLQLNFRKIEEAVDDINERISLMAFNAFLEAARAGETGKGFQVIAEELRRLADRSSKSSSEMKKLFEEISNKLSNATLT